MKGRSKNKKRERMGPMRRMIVSGSWFKDWK
jgi:hypothetical protein